MHKNQKNLVPLQYNCDGQSTHEKVAQHCSLQSKLQGGITSHQPEWPLLRNKRDFPGGPAVKNLPRDAGSIPGGN